MEEDLVVDEDSNMSYNVSDKMVSCFCHTRAVVKICRPNSKNDFITIIVELVKFIFRQANPDSDVDVETIQDSRDGLSAAAEVTLALISAEFVFGDTLKW